MRWRSKRTLVGIAAAAVLATGGGVAFAATQAGEGEGGGEQALADVAERVGVSADELKAAFRAEALERLDAAVAAGRLTEAQAAEIRERIESGERPFGGHHRGHHGPGVHGLETAAEYLGLEPEALFEELRGGATLAEVAEAQGKSVEGLEAALLAEAKERIHELVTEGFPAHGEMDEDVAAEDASA